MNWTVLLLLDGPRGSEAQITWATAHVMASSPAGAAHRAYDQLVYGEDLCVLDLVVFQGHHENALGRTTSVIRAELNA